MRAASLVLALLPLFFVSCERPSAHNSNPLNHDVYVWQRVHSAAVGHAVRAHADSFQTVVALAAEVSWEKTPPSSLPVPRITRVAPDWAALAACHRVGLALRINSHPGPFTRDDTTTRALVVLARELIADASLHGVQPVELQIDFDAATAKLAGYRIWLETLRAAIAPMPLVFTALPAWLHSSEFAGLARSTGSFILQVHSLARPRDVNAPFTLCDPTEARDAIERAALAGVSFRVALPTYGYVLTFNSAGHFAGLSAEGPRRGWRDGSITREVAADPVALAPLVRALAADHPALLTGVIWYRLPVPGDALNWSWPTLNAVMQGRTPAPLLRVEARADTSGLLELFVCNTGDGDFAGPVRLVARWNDARRLAADALGDFTIVAEDAASLHLTASGCHLAAHATQSVGWLRLSSSTAHSDVSLEN